MDDCSWLLIDWLEYLGWEVTESLFEYAYSVFAFSALFLFLSVYPADFSPVAISVPPAQSGVSSTMCITAFQKPE